MKQVIGRFNDSQKLMRILQGLNPVAFDKTYQLVRLKMGGEFVLKIVADKLRKRCK